MPSFKKFNEVTQKWEPIGGVPIDKTLTNVNTAAEAKAVGDKLATKIGISGHNAGKVLGADDSGNIIDKDIIVRQDTEPTDKNVLWIDTNDDTNPAQIVVDPTLSVSGHAADAKIVGDEINKYKTAVLFTPQELTEPQRVQARKNTDTIGVYIGDEPPVDKNYLWLDSSDNTPLGELPQSEKIWEKIKTVEITADKNYLSEDKETDGTSFNFAALKLMITTPAKLSDNVVFNFKNATGTMLSGLAITYTETTNYSVVICEKVHGYYETTAVKSSNIYATTSDMYRSSFAHENFVANATIAKVTSNVMTEGAKIDIWAVRA